MLLFLHLFRDNIVKYIYFFAYATDAWQRSNGTSSSRTRNTLHIFQFTTIDIKQSRNSVYRKKKTNAWHARNEIQNER